MPDMGLSSVIAFARDLRAAAATARRQPIFTAFVVLVLAFGIGASIAIFSVVDGVLLRELPYRDPARLVWLWSMRPDGTRFPFAIQDVVDLRERSTAFDTIAAMGNWSVAFTGGGAPERLQGLRVTPALFGALGMQPAAGRLLRDGDDTAGRVVVITHGFWTRRFGADPSVIGRSLSLNGASYEVVGVLPPTFTMPVAASEVVVPLVEAEVRRAEGATSFLRIVGRLKDGVTVRQAEAQVTRIAAELQTLRPATNARKAGIAVDRLHDAIAGNNAATLRMLLAAVLIVLLLVAVNLAGLSLARASSRQRELAVRVALGADRLAITRQLVAESVLPAAISGVLGVLFGEWGARVLLSAAPTALPRADEIGINGDVALFALAITVATGIAIGLIPALQIRRLSASDDLRGAGRATAGRRALMIRRLLVGVQVAVSLVLLVAIGLLVRSLRIAQAVDPGFAPEHALTMRLALPRTRYVDRADILAFQQRLEQRLRALPGVRAVGGVNVLPLSGAQASVDFAVVGRPIPSDRLSTAEYRMITPSYLDAAGIHLTSGRRFTDRDVSPAADVAIVNQTMVDRLFQGRSPIGEHLHIQPETAAIARIVEIVGVVRDVKHFSLENPPNMDLYVPVGQVPQAFMVWLANNQFWVLRTEGNPMALADAARAGLAEADSEVPAIVRTFEQAVERSLAARRFNLILISLFGYAALVLTACGIYAVSAQGVELRRRELGIRSALGASPRSLVTQVLGADAKVVVIGLAAGLLIARLASGAAAKLTFGVRATDPMTYAAVAALLAAVAAAACALPAVRAGRTDPIRVLRSD
jgi:putative ABC transport system permease protein